MEGKWFHPDSFAYNRRFEPGDLGPLCRSCERAEQCRGACSAMSYGAMGRLHNDPYCFSAIRRRSAAALLRGQRPGNGRRPSVRTYPL